VSLAWWNGRIVPADEVAVAPWDAGLLFGDGLFETLRVDDGRVRDVEAHLDRLRVGLRKIRLELPEDRRTLRRAIARVAEAAPRPVARMRLTVTRGHEGRPTRLITTTYYDPPGEDYYRRGVTARLLHSCRIDSGGPLCGVKSLCFQLNRLALREAESQGAYEALLLNERGRLVEGSRTNVALAFPDGIVTPPRSDGCLPGTVRRRLLEKGMLAEQPVSPEDLALAGEVLLMNSLIGVLPVSRVNNWRIAVGPTAARLRDMLESA
jgi:branched-chain amino acid aminotransferase